MKLKLRRLWLLFLSAKEREVLRNHRLLGNSPPELLPKSPQKWW